LAQLASDHQASPLEAIRYHAGVGRQQHRQALGQQKAAHGRCGMAVGNQQNECNGCDLVAGVGDGPGGAERQEWPVAQETPPRAGRRRRLEVRFFCSGFDFRSAVG
jgi:hypothetical protein